MAIPRDVLAGLLSDPLDAFVERRGALVKRARAAKTPQLAAEVAAVRKPPISVWAVDRLARDHPESIRAALDAGVVLRALHQRMLAGDTAAGGGLREAGEHLMVAVEACGRAAAAILEDAGHAAPESTRRRVETTIRAAAVGTRPVRDDLRAGVLTADLDPPGFGALELDEDEEDAVPAAMAAPAIGPEGVASSAGAAPDVTRGARAAARARRAAVLDAQRSTEAAAAESERTSARLHAAAREAAAHRDQLAAALSIAAAGATATGAAAARAAAEARAARQAAVRAAAEAEKVRGATI